jgi:hypothetical protein
MPGADGQLICTSSEVDRCIEAPLPFATLSECLTTCTPSFDPRATDCKTSGGAIVCAADKSARRAHLTALLPLGALDLRHAWMERYQGFLNGITIHFDSGPDAQDEVSPSVALSLLDPTDAMGLPRVHTTAVAVSLCSGSLALAASVTITIDEVTDHRSERIEGHIKGLDEALKLEGDFAFDRACRVTTND